MPSPFNVSVYRNVWVAIALKKTNNIISTSVHMWRTGRNRIVKEVDKRWKIYNFLFACFKFKIRNPSIWISVLHTSHVCEFLVCTDILVNFFLFFFFISPFSQSVSTVLKSLRYTANMCACIAYGRSMCLCE